MNRKKVQLLKRAFGTIEYNHHQFTMFKETDKGSNGELKRMVLDAKKHSEVVGDAQALRDLNERLERKFGV